MRLHCMFLIHKKNWIISHLFMIHWFTLLVLYVFHFKKCIISHLFMNQTNCLHCVFLIQIRIICSWTEQHRWHCMFWFTKEPDHKIHLFVNRTTLFMLYVFESQKSQIIKSFFCELDYSACAACFWFTKRTRSLESFDYTDHAVCWTRSWVKLYSMLCLRAEDISNYFTVLGHDLASEKQCRKDWLTLTVILCWTTISPSFSL